MDTIDDGLYTLIERGFRFQHLRDDHGRVSIIVGSYGWPEFYDRIHLYGESDAAAARAVLDSRPGADEVVWTHQGDALSTICALLELPKPHEPNAPRLARHAPFGLWLPGTGQPVLDLRQQ